MPPLAVVSARTSIGVPVAGFPFPIPHLTADVFSLPTSVSPVFPDDPPQAATAATIASASAAARAARRYLVIFLSSESTTVDWFTPAAGRWQRPHTNAVPVTHASAIQTLLTSV